MQITEEVIVQYSLVKYCSGETLLKKREFFFGLTMAALSVGSDYCRQNSLIYL